MNANEWRTHFENIIENNNLYGASFTYGVALYKHCQNGGDDQIDDILAWHAADVLGITYDKAYDVLTTKALAEIVDLSILDEVARELAGETDEDEE